MSQKVKNYLNVTKVQCKVIEQVKTAKKEINSSTMLVLLGEDSEGNGNIS